LRPSFFHLLPIILHPAIWLDRKNSIFEFVRFTPYLSRIVLNSVFGNESLRITTFGNISLRSGIGVNRESR